MSGEVLMERRPAAPASGHLSIHRQQMHQLLEAQVYAAAKVIFRTAAAATIYSTGKLPQYQTQPQKLYEVRTCCHNSDIYCWQAAATVISIAGKLPQQQYVLLASCRNSNIYYLQAATTAISIACKLTQHQYVLLASCRNSIMFCWQAASTAISIAGKLLQQQYVLLASCRRHFFPIKLLKSLCPTAYA